MNHGAKHYRTMPRCPSCGASGNVIKDGATAHGRQRYRCTRCGNQVHEGDAPAPKEVGNVAGKITIGRGSVWGVGLA